MTSNNKKTIAVVGATGIQGSSVARTFATLPTWNVRCLTRDPSSQKSQDLAKLGCDVVRADLADAASLRGAFDGAHAIFLNTDFWGPYRALLAAGVESEAASRSAYDVEVSHGKNAVAAAAGAPALERMVYSALGPMKAASDGKYPHAYHWETKASIVNYIEEEQPQVAEKTSYVYIGAYIDNRLLYPKLDTSTGEYSLVLPGKSQTMFPIIDTAQSTGPFVKALIEGEAPGTKLLAYDSYMSVGEVVDVWSRVTGKPARFVGSTIEEMRKLTGLPAEILDGPAFIDEFGYTAGIANVIGPDALKTKVETRGFEEWLRTKDVQELLDGSVKM